MSGIHVRVSGVVQGVGFRWFVRERARRLNLAGWVRNLPDGSVEIAASGAAEGIAQLRQLVEQGPRGATVDRVEELAPVAEPLDAPFAIKY